MLQNIKSKHDYVVNTFYQFLTASLEAIKMRIKIINDLTRFFGTFDIFIKDSCGTFLESIDVLGHIFILSAFLRITNETGRKETICTHDIHQKKPRYKRI